MTDELKKTQDPAADPAQDPAEREADDNITPEDLAGKIYAAGEPLPIDPETGKIEIEKLTEAQKAELEIVSEQIIDAVAKATTTISPAIGAFIDSTNRVIEGIRKSSGFYKLQETFKTLSKSILTDEMRELLRDITESLQPIQDLLTELDELEPYIKAELAKEEYDGLTFDRLMDYTPGELLEMRQDPESRLYKVFEAAKAEHDALPNVSAHGVNEYPVTLDKINTMVVFDFLRTLDPDGQITMLPIKEEGSGSPVEITSYYSLTFSDDLPPEIKRKLTPYDRLVYGAVDAVQKKNGNIMSITQVHRAMGNSKPPSKAQYKKIHDSIVKVNAAHATLNCGQVRDQYDNEGYIDYYGSLFPMEMQRAIINGQLVEGAIHILRDELPLISVAKGRNHQIEEIPTALLDSKLSQTDPNIAMEFYVLEQLLKIKNGKSKTHNKILYSTIYEKMGAKSDKQRQRAKKAFFTYLDELAEKNFIKSYKEETTRSTGETGVTFKY